MAIFLEMFLLGDCDLLLLYSDGSGFLEPLLLLKFFFANLRSFCMYQNYNLFGCLCFGGYFGLSCCFVYILRCCVFIFHDNSTFY